MLSSRSAAVLTQDGLGQKHADGEPAGFWGADQFLFRVGRTGIDRGAVLVGFIG